MTNYSATLWIISAPSAAGKSTLVEALLARDSQLRPSVSWTTRQPRQGEIEGSHYHFVSEAQFRQAIAEGGFLEWATVHGQFYGTPRAPVESALQAGNDIVLVIDCQGAAQVRAHSDLAEAMRSIFVLPPSWQTLRQRLNNRNSETPESIKRRLTNAKTEMAEWPLFDFLLVNDDLNTAVDNLHSIVKASRLSRRVQEQRLIDLLTELTGADFALP